MPLPTPGPLSRRSVLAVGGAVTASAALVVTGCSTYAPPGGASGDAGAQSGGAQPPAGAPATEGGGAGGSGGAGAGGAALGQASDIPVGGGKVYAAQKVVVTQPAAGQFKAFSAVCTHAGCTVSTVANGTISCPCHGSEFSATDGSVKGGPAKRPLAAKTVTDDGGTLRVS